ncbi:MAG TPA: GDSL-type esterase/lipase family protein [Elusimicrobiales bacterium]|nr:GDSL-type esterase/lipase family protein [Elusimicrobiales bacterium]
MKTRKILTLLYPVFLLVFLEVASRIFLFSGYGMQTIEKISCDTSWRLLWANKKRAGAGDIFYSFDEYSPTRGWAIKPNLTKTPVFGGKVLSTNSKGIRGKTEYTYGKSSKKRILILGDSFTFGEEVNDTEAYPSRLQELLPASEVINFGVHGYAHDQMLIYLKEEGIKYRPDIIILGIVSNDIQRNILRFRDYAKPKFKIMDGKLKLENSPVPAPGEYLKREPYRSKLADLLDLFRQVYRQKRGLDDQEMGTVTVAILDELIAVARQNGAVPVLVYLPFGAELLADAPQDGFLPAYSRSRSVHYLSLQPVFHAKANSGVALKVTGHWDETEHQIAAGAIRKYLSDNKI